MWYSLLDIIWFIKIILNESNGQQIWNSTHSGGNISCPTNATECYLICKDCKNSIIECSTNSDCKTCIVKCEGKESCNTATLYSYECDNVIVKSISGDDLMTNMKIYAPSNNGNLLVDITQGGQFAFHYGKIYSQSQSGSITLICDDFGYDNECADIIINATTAQHLYYECNGNTQCSTNTIYCPNNNYGTTTQGTSCIYNCSNAVGFGSDVACAQSIMYAQNGIPQDVKWVCNNDNSDVCTNGIIYCHEETSWSDSCEMQYSNNIWECNINSGNTCFIPTQYPTYLPTNSPTNNNTFDNPTNNPTKNPTNGPTNIPSNSPSNGSTSYPTNYPNIYPTNHSSNYPTNYPTNYSTNYSTNYPTYYPIGNKDSSLTTFDITIIILISIGLLLCCIFCCFKLFETYFKQSQLNEIIASKIIKNNYQQIQKDDELQGIDLQMNSKTSVKNETNDGTSKEIEGKVDVKNS